MRQSLAVPTTQLRVGSSYARRVTRGSTSANLLWHRVDARPARGPACIDRGACCQLAAGADRQSASGVFSPFERRMLGCRVRGPGVYAPEICDGSSLAERPIGVPPTPSDERVSCT